MTPNGKVIGVEHIPELVQWSESNVRKHNSDLMESKTLEFFFGDGRIGHASCGPYQAIHVGAAAKTLPQEVNGFHLEIEFVNNLITAC